MNSCLKVQINDLLMQNKKAEDNLINHTTD